MFGQNPTRKQDLNNPLLAVQEIFPTLQGEGPFAGVPAIFIRLAGCNLKCHFCDTDFESNINNMLMPESMCGAVDSYLADFPGIELVVITGGEPLRQNIIPLLNYLFRLKIKHVQIETAGTLWVDGLETFITSKRVSLVCSPKTPKIHDMVALYCEDWKYIIKYGETDEVDGLPNTSTQVKGIKARIFRPNESPLRLRAHNIWVQPCDEQRGGVEKDADTIGNEMHAVQIAMKHGYRLSYQTHKALGLK